MLVVDNVEVQSMVNPDTVFHVRLLKTNTVKDALRKLGERLGPEYHMLELYEIQGSMSINFLLLYKIM